MTQVLPASDTFAEGAVSYGTFLPGFWMPIVLSTCQGGISRFTTRALIERAHGRTL